MKNVVIAGYARSPFTPAKRGDLARVRPDDLAAQVVRELIVRTGVKAEDIEDLIVGCAFPEAEQGFNIARLIGMIADLPQSVAGVTVNRFCGSSMQAIHMAAGQIQLGAGEVFVCAGVESMSRVPMTGFNPMPNPALHAKNHAAYMGMGDTAENVARKWQITRADQDAFALASQQKAAPRAGGGAAEGRDRRHHLQARHGGSGWLHPRRDHAGRPRRPEARLRPERLGDGGHLLPPYGRRLRGAGLYRGLCREAWP